MSFVRILWMSCDFGFRAKWRHENHMTLSKSVCASPPPRKTRETVGAHSSSYFVKMLALFQRVLDWFKSLFWKEEMELTLVGLQYSGKTTFVNVIAVSGLMMLWQMNPHQNRQLTHCHSQQPLVPETTQITSKICCFSICRVEYIEIGSFWGHNQERRL